MNAESTQSVCSPGTGQPGISHWANFHQAPVNQSPVIWLQVPCTSHWSIRSYYQAPGTGQLITSHQSTQGTGHDMHQLMGTDYWVPIPAWRLSCSVTKSYEQIVRTLSTEGAMQNLVKIAQAVSEKKRFKNYTFFLHLYSQSALLADNTRGQNFDSN